MTSCPPPGRITELMRGALDPIEHADVEAHLDRCEACDELVSVLARLEVPGVTLRQWIDDLVGPALEQRVAMGLRIIDTFLARQRRGEPVRTLALDRTTITDEGELAIDGEGLVSPEQLATRSATPTAEQYLAALACWEVLAGSSPHAGATPGARAVAMTAIPSIPGDHPDRARLVVLARALHPDPARRWASLDELRRAWIDPRPRAYVTALVAAAIVVVTAAVLAIAR